MARGKSPGGKDRSLAECGAVNPRAEKVQDELFQTHPFFDPRDLVQVKYEMLRRVRLEGWKAALAATRFGFSRVTFYQAKAAFERGGVGGLLPRKKGPRRAHKLSPAVLELLNQARQERSSVSPAALSELLREKCGIEVHPRTIERALKKKKRKGSWGHAPSGGRTA